MSEDTTPTNKDAQSAPKKSNAVMLIAVAVVVLALAGGGAWFFLHHGKTAEAAPPEAASLHTVHLEGFTVNLSDPEESHFLRITIDLGLAHAPKAAKEGEGEVPTARVRDTLLMVLTKGKANDLVTQEGKTQLKKDLLAALQQNLPELDVREVYFTEFLVQR
jgi:flagellar protein FliL